MTRQRKQHHPNQRAVEPQALPATDLRAQARAAVAAGDKHRALALLRGVATGELDGTSLADGEARALVATASAASMAQPPDEAMKRGRKAKSTILALLQSAELETTDLNDIDAVVHARLVELTSREQLRIEQLESQVGTIRRLGTGTIEAKMISNGHSTRLFGPYLYARFMDGGRYRSRYIGKATAVGSDKQ